VKKILAVGLAAFLGASALILLHGYRTVPDRTMSAVEASSSQIFIHGTPVCVFKLDDGIIAKVGRCEDAETGTPQEKSPFSGNPGRELPPGHPPVDRDAFPDGQRGVLI
jgi:hypothetical protein